jgi:RDD family
MNRYQVLAVLVLAFIAMNWASTGQIGATSECHNGHCVVSAASSWVAIVVALGMGIFLALYRPRTQALDPSRVVGVWRRFGAFFVDFTSVVMIVSPLAALPVLVAEANYTATFKWSFMRDYSRPTDAPYILSAVLVMFGALFSYFYLHARYGRPTVGPYVLGYRVTHATGAAPSYARRIVLSFVGLCMWPVSVILALRKPQKSFWWDTATNTMVTRVVG